MLLSKSYFHFDPCDATHDLDTIIISTHLSKCFLSRVEVNLNDPEFILVDDNFYFSNLFVRVKGVTLFKASWSSFAWITVRKSETNWIIKIPLDFSEKDFKVLPDFSLQALACLEKSTCLLLLILKIPEWCASLLR